MRRRVVPDAQPITRVNVTPIIDVALVLVIILLVTAPMLSVADLPVNLPAAHTREAESAVRGATEAGAGAQEARVFRGRLEVRWRAESQSFHAGG